MQQKIVIILKRAGGIACCVNACLNLLRGNSERLSQVSQQLALLATDRVFSVSVL